MLTRDQKYAIDAYKHVQKVHKDLEQAEAKSYGVMAHKLPILIHTAGLAQALAFVDARAKVDKKEKGSKKVSPQKMLLHDLAITIGKESADKLLLAARESQLVEYILLTKQIMNALLWYKRYAQSILNVDVGDTDDDDKESTINAG